MSRPLVAHQAAPVTAVPAGTRVPWGFSAWSVPAPDQGVARLAWPAGTTLAGPASLRLTTAIDSRERQVFALRTASGRRIGSLDLRLAHPVEIFQHVLAAEDVAEILADGLVIEMVEGTKPAWFLAADAAGTAPWLAPHLMPWVPSADPAARFRERLASRDCMHTFGWMEGCILDAYAALDALEPTCGWDAILRQHLARCFPPGGGLVCETAKSEISDDRIASIEETLMFVFLARCQPDHPWIDGVQRFWAGKMQDGVVVDHHATTAEGSYTIAYPMAAVAALRGDAALAAQALAQLERRRATLRHDGAIWLRWYPNENRRTYRNWARGVTWHFLGSVRTAQTLVASCLADPAPILAELPALAALVLPHQRADGLWNCYLDDVDGQADTSGSAGIAAALAVAANAGWLPGECRTAAARTWQGLLTHLTPDGLLGGVAQSNRGGEDLQRSGYRVISQMGMGLMGQLDAALRS